MRVMGGAHFLPSEHPSSSNAPCPSCTKQLRFYTGDYGQLLEVCDTSQCSFSQPHVPAPILPLLPSYTKKARKGNRIPVI